MPITVAPRRRGKKLNKEKKDKLSPRSKVKREGLKDIDGNDVKTGAKRKLSETQRNFLNKQKLSPRFKIKEKELLDKLFKKGGADKIGKPVKPKPKPKPKKKPESAKTKTLEYKGTPVGKRKRSRPA
jgi:hypothetical protein